MSNSVKLILKLKELICLIGKLFFTPVKIVLGPIYCIPELCAGEGKSLLIPWYF
ncbi:hypothetical protein GCM10007928_52590 [Sulfitobacter porphyrae]|nr:hypothetical protein GCM10007928_52590 [Sulfitobacter porphyrae]